MNSPSPRMIASFDALSFLHAELNEHRTTFESTAPTFGPSFLKALAVMSDGLRNGGKLMFFGNGGSAADAQHIAAELMIRYKADRPAIPAISLTSDASTMTACANDLGFESLFERQIAGLGRQCDVAIGISTSGKSANVLRGFRQARHMGMRTVALTGSGGYELSRTCDAAIVVPSAITARIQEMHIFIGHALCKALERSLGLV